MEDTKRRRSNERPGVSQRTPPPSVDTDHTRVWDRATKHESELDRATAQRTLHCLLAKVQVSIDRCQKAHRKGTVAAHHDQFLKVPGPNGQMNPGHPPLETLARGSRWPPPWGLPSKRTAAEDAQSCTSARTIHGDPGYYSGTWVLLGRPPGSGIMTGDRLYKRNPRTPPAMELLNRCERGLYFKNPNSRRPGELAGHETALDIHASPA